MVKRVMCMVLTKQSTDGRFVAIADLSVPAFEVRHLLHDDLYEIVCRYVGKCNSNSATFVKRLFKNINLF